MMPKLAFSLRGTMIRMTSTYGAIAEMLRLPGLTPSAMRAGGIILESMIWIGTAIGPITIHTVGSGCRESRWDGVPFALAAGAICRWVGLGSAMNPGDTTGGVAAMW